MKNPQIPEKPPAPFRTWCACYRALLFLYPRAHREQFGPLMLQHFRDQCRDAARSTMRDRLRFIVQCGSDFFSSLVQENLSSSSLMIRHLISSTKLPSILLVLAVGLGFLAAYVASHGQQGLGAVLAHLSLATLVLRGIAECYRPADQWVRATGWGVLIAIIYGFIAPLWARFQVIPISGSGLLVALFFAALGANIVVPLGKAIIALRMRTI